MSLSFNEPATAEIWFFTKEQHVLDTYAVLMCHRCLTKAGVEKMNNFKGLFTRPISECDFAVSYSLLQIIIMG